MDSEWLEELELYTGCEETLDSKILSIARAIEKSKKVTILTGAGVSVQSGIPDFRSSNGIWKRYDPKKCGSLEYFKKNPTEFWKMSEELHNFKSKPSQAHKALAELDTLNINNTIITQNIDGLHQAAGSKHVIEMHGTGKVCTCLNCDYIEFADKAVWNKPLPPSECIPRCPKCGGLIKLDVVMFGDRLNKEICDEAVEASTDTDFLLVIGTSLKVAPCNTIPIRAKQIGAQVGFINCEKTILDEFADYKLNGDLQEIVPKIVEKVKEIREKRRNGFNRLLTFSFSVIFTVATLILDLYNLTFDKNYSFSYTKKTDTPPQLGELVPLKRHSIPIHPESSVM